MKFKPQTRISFKRSVTDYSKIQALIGKIFRNRTFYIRSKRIDNKKYLDVGCGPNTHPDFVNLDFSWTPTIDVCWDLTKSKLPFENEKFYGIFTEHCLEHISFEGCERSIREFYRILKPGGILRIIVPDGELYLDIYQRRKAGEQIEMPYESGYISPMHRINGIFRNHGHQIIYDFDTFNILLNRNGFKEIEKKAFRIGSNQDLLIDSEHRKVESLYIEAMK